MLLRIHHTVRYRYSRSVKLEPTIVRLHPREDHAQRLLEYKLDVSPTPTGITEGIDLDGNIVRRLWFDGYHERMTITAKSVVETVMTNPFGYVLPPATLLTLPMKYPTDEALHLGGYLVRPDVDPIVDLLAQRLADASKGDAARYLSALNMYLYNHCRKQRRDSGDPYPPGKTLREGSGACRDTAALFVDACRANGIAARFVSGYHFVEPSEDTPRVQHDLHAWAEAYLPTAGWRGYDPTVGLAIADRHVSVAASADPTGAAAVAGSYVGPNVASDLDFDVSIQAA